MACSCCHASTSASRNDGQSVTVTTVTLPFLSFPSRPCLSSLTTALLVSLSLAPAALLLVVDSPAIGQSPVMLLSPSDLSRRCLSVDSFLSYHPGWPSLQPQPNNFCYPFVYAVAPTGRPSCARAVLGSGLVAGIALGAASILMVFLACCRCRCGLYAGREWLDYLSQQTMPELNQLLVGQGCRIDFGVQIIQ